MLFISVCVTVVYFSSFKFAIRKLQYPNKIYKMERSRTFTWEDPAIGVTGK